MEKYLVLIGEEEFTVEANSRYEAKKVAASEFIKRHELKNVNMSDITVYLANEYKLPKPEPKCTTEEAIKFLTKSTQGA